MWPTIVFGAALLLLSAGLIISHLIAQRSYNTAEMEADERSYRGSQFRRRMQASALIGVVGVAVLGGLWIDGPPGEALYWCGVLLVVIWICLLAGADAASTQSFFRDVQKRRAAEHAALQPELDRYRRHVGNGRRENEVTQ
jgi:hypothetical protein